MGVVLALAAAVAYGASDFVGGLLSRRASSYLIAVYAQVASAVVVGAAAALLPAPGLTAGALCWGALSGVGNGLGTVFLYRGLGSGRMSVVAPLSAVGAAGLPVLVGLATGERPPLLALLGIALAVPAIWLISRPAPTPPPTTEKDLQPAAREPQQREEGSQPPEVGETLPRPGAVVVPKRSGVVDGVLAGVGFAVLFIALGRVHGDAGLWPVAAGQLVALVSVAVAALVAGVSLRRPGRAGLGAPAAGLLGATAVVLYLFATRSQLVSVAAVLTSLYPALTVLAAIAFLRERIGRGQAVGLVAAAAAVSLIALS
jgi:drug/metabolite transporter (DMT)-like permease